MSTLGDLRHLQATRLVIYVKPIRVYTMTNRVKYMRNDPFFCSRVALFMRVCKCVAVVGISVGKQEGGHWWSEM